MCPRCSTSKQPLVSTIRRPAARSAATRSVRVAASRTPPVGRSSRASRSSAEQTEVPNRCTTTSAAAWASSTAAGRSSPLTRPAARAAVKVSPAPDAWRSGAGWARVRKGGVPSVSSRAPSRSRVTATAAAPLAARSAGPEPARVSARRPSGSGVVAPEQPVRLGGVRRDHVGLQPLPAGQVVGVDHDHWRPAHPAYGSLHRLRQGRRPVAADHQGLGPARARRPRRRPGRRAGPVPPPRPGRRRCGA